MPRNGPGHFSQGVTHYDLYEYRTEITHLVGKDWFISNRQCSDLFFNPSHTPAYCYAAFLMRLSRTAYRAVSKGRTGSVLSKSVSVNA